MKSVRNYRSRFIAPILAGALVITPLTGAFLPATADDLDVQSNSATEDPTSVEVLNLEEAETDATEQAADAEETPAPEATEEAPVVEETEEAPAAEEDAEEEEAAAQSLLAVEADADAVEEATHTIAEARQAPNGTEVTLHGVVTANYPVGGFNGFIIQTEGTGAALPADGASDAVFVYKKLPDGIVIGDFVEVVGKTGVFNGLAQISTIQTIEKLSVEAEQITPLTIPWPKTNAERQAVQSMLFMPTGDYTVTETYNTNVYGEVGLAFDDKPLRQPTDVARPGTPEAAAIEAKNKEISLPLDDGANTRFRDEQDKVLPYVSLENPLRVGAPAVFTEPVIIDYRNNTWKLNPTSAVGPGEEPVEFKNTREAAPKVAGDITVAGFNVLNYFPTTGADWEVLGNSCTFYTDRAGNNITNDRCDNNGPRGAADDVNLKRQEDKIVAAISELDASVVGLMEIENSAKLGQPVDEALATLVGALNSKAGTQKWAYVPSSTDLPKIADQDVISNGIIYQPDEVDLFGDSRAFGEQSGSGQAFSNAREPLAQAFVPAEGGKPFMAVVNHFKSKGSGSDDGTGQGNANPDRIAQANALATWVDTLETETGVEDIALLGDFNSYTQEDPMQVFYSEGYTNAVQAYVPEKQTYNFSGLNGSLDHILYNESMKTRVTGGDTWNVNAPESIALEYSRYNSHGALYYEPNAYRSSDHDPVVIGLEKGEAQFKEFNLLGINDFHGRIDNNTVAFAGTVEESRADYPDRTLFMSAGDNIGASLFASAVQRDEPTIDVLNALDLKASAVGNHEFDSGYDNLIGDAIDWADFAYLGANVYKKGTTTPALDEYELVTVDGITFGMIGVVTEETPTLVTPGGIANLDFGDPVDAVNRVAEKLSDGNPANGEADVIVALYHEGAGSGEPDGSTLEQEIAESAVFKKIVVESADEVDVIFTGHTHKQYAWMDEVPNPDRPIIQTGNYGEFIGQSVVTVDMTTQSVVSATADNIARLDIPKGTPEDEKAAAKAALNEKLISTYPRVAEVNEIVEAALAFAAVEGNVPVGTITADITTAFTDASFVDGFWTENEGGGKRDDRGSPSTLGNLVANSLRDSLSDPLRGGADFGVVNPGGLRADLLFAKSGAETKDGVVTFAEANAVLPFVNNLWTTTLTGDQVKVMLEQQWQRGDDGEIPSRSYLQLGLSDNVTYTFDATRDEGDRITSIVINGEALDLARDYVVGTFSFLAQGGDNFRVFRDATGTRDSGLIDRDAWVDYLEANENLSPDFARTGIEIPKVTDKVKVGDVVEFPVGSLNMTSLDSPENTELVATFLKDGKALGEAAGKFVVVDGATTVKFTVPAGAAGGDSLQLIATESGTTVTLPMTVTAIDDGDGDGDGDGDDGDGDGNGAGTGNGNGNGNNNGSGKLPTTGTNAFLPIAFTLLLLAAGGSAVFVGRRRQV